MPLTILNVGHEDDATLLREVTTSSDRPASIRSLTNLKQAHLWAVAHQPDIMVVDLRRLNGHGIEFMRHFRTDPACIDIPLLAVMNERDRDHRGQALLAGASELITAPLDPYECQVRILNLLTLSAQRRLLRQGLWSDDSTGEWPQFLQAREREILLRLARAGEFRDEDTGAHIVRIGKISRHIAEALDLQESDCDIIEAAAPIHDIGKIGIPDSILRKPGPLTESERKVMENHTQIGYDILKNSTSKYLQCGAEIALAHHEKFDGSGYPHGVRGEEIPLCARIVAVADVYDALTHRRPYKLAWPKAKVVEHLEKLKGEHFDPRCVDALFAPTKSVANFQ
ncbi:MAG TPA: HD domain-containing phosphohydrolase [Burkholderiales bacterium]|nr:HD domain-containing phosphohydrolase [Burkholderiales bacterium]